LRRHNSNHSGFTGTVNDWVVVYSESYSEKSLAAKREREVKSWNSRVRIERLISGSCQLVQASRFWGQKEFLKEGNLTVRKPNFAGQFLSD
ncbi:MAG: GIY-YIG nuclease family protein, partial [Bacteroidota bacterium]